MSFLTIALSVAEHRIVEILFDIGEVTIASAVAGWVFAWATRRFSK